MQTQNIKLRMVDIAKAANLKHHDIIYIVGQSRKYALLISISADAYNDALPYITNEEEHTLLDDILYCKKDKDLSPVYFTSIEKAYKHLETANLLSKFSIRLMRGIIHKQ